MRNDETIYLDLRGQAYMEDRNGRRQTIPAEMQSDHAKSEAIGYFVDGVVSCWQADEIIAAHAKALRELVAEDGPDAEGRSFSLVHHADKPNPVERWECVIADVGPHGRQACIGVSDTAIGAAALAMMTMITYGEFGHFLLDAFPGRDPKTISEDELEFAAQAYWQSRGLLDDSAVQRGI